jgi:hypothetical protein
MRFANIASASAANRRTKAVHIVHHIIDGAFWLLILALMFAYLRNLWVVREMMRWIEVSPRDFAARAPSYTFMFWRFWVWDIRKFGRRL